MTRTWAIVCHALLSVIAGVLYYFCVLPRMSELMGETPHALGMAGRIASGALIGLAALPVVFTLLRTRKPELGTPQLALSIRLWSTVAHVLAGVLIVGTAISEIWLSLDAAGQWLFGIYGAAAAIAVLGIFGFYLAFVAELPPPPPKPIKLKQPKEKRKGRKKRGKDEVTDTEEADEVTEAEEAGDTDEADENEEADETEAVEITESEHAEITESEADEITESEADEITEAEAATQEAPVADDTEVTTAVEKPKARLQNRRPTGKTTHRRRRPRGGGVAVED